MNAVTDPNLTTIRVAPYAKCYEAQVLSLARAMHAESHFHRDIPIDEAKLIQQLEAAAASDSHYFRLCVRGDEVLGGFLGTLSTVYFSRDLVAKDLAWFVAKYYRGTRAAVMLVRDFEAWAREKGAQHFILGQSTGVAIETTRALYLHLGYEVVGFNTVKKA